QKKNLRFLDFSQNLFYDTIPIRGTLFLYHLSLHRNFQSQSNFFTEKLKDKLAEFFNCQYKHFVEFTALI
ncbi:hypothetical protein HN51_016133, partial [Arachis hypogaea]